MTPQDIRAALKKIPFRLILTDGTVYEVKHPELCMVGKRTAVIGLVDSPGTEQNGSPAFDRYVVVSLLHVVRIEPFGAAVQ